MASVPYPLTGESMGELKSQIYEVLRQLYEEKIGGADLGDVFSIPGDVLTLVLNPSTSGLQKTGNQLAVLLPSDSGLTVNTNGIYIKNISTGGLEVSASGVAIKLNGTSLTCDVDGLKVTSASNITSGVATLVLGTVTVNNAAVTANSRIFLTPQDNDTVGALRISARVVGVSFTILSTVLTDTGVVTWLLLEP